MADYTEIKGNRIQYLDSDPTLTSANEGQVWYNTATGTLKGLVQLQAWSSGAPLSSPRHDAGGAGIQTAGLMFGGRNPGPLSATEEYNGSGWSTGGNINLARQQIFSFGSQTAAVGASGYRDSGGPGFRQETEEYDGTSWTEVNNCPIASFAGAGFGVLTAGVACGGRVPSPTNSTAEYDGTTWTAANNMTASLQQLAGVGTQTAGATFGGHNGTAIVDTVQEYDGTSWSDVTNLPAARSLAGTSGIQTAAIIFGGNSPSVVNTTLDYDGTTVSSNPATMATARNSLSYPSGAPASTNTAAFAAGGYSTASTGVTEEYNKSINVITPAAWSSGGNMLYARANVADGGTQTAAIEGAGRQDNPDVSFTTSSEYNGSSWTAGNILPAYKSGTGATGTQTALITGGAGSGSTTTFEYDGTNWTTGGSLGTGRYSGKNLGTQTAAVYCGGRVSPPTLNNVEEYDGSTWTSATGMPVATRSGGGYGVQTAGTIVSGYQGPSTPPVSPTATISRSLPGFNYDGTSWTTGTSALIAGASGGAAGTQTNAIYLAGGNPALSPAAITTSQKYDGTSYTTDAAVGRSQATGFGITSSRTAEVGSAAMIFGGTNPPATPGDFNSTEEYNVVTTALNYKTLTSS